MVNLRRLLQAITEVQDVSKHPALLAAATLECPNTVRILPSPHPIERYTCLVHALDFTERPEYVAIAERGFNVVFAGRSFAHWLIDRRLINEVAAVDANEGDLVFYFNEERQFQHAGVIAGNHRVISKWGTGHLFEHGLFEVPESYGTIVRFFQHLASDEAYDHFVTFAKEKGFLFL